jgi:indole-3-glycerol phosphate synthase
MDILEEIVAHKKVELERMKQAVPAKQLYARVEQIADTEVASMSEAIMKSASGIIAEFKRKSPSLGWIHEKAKAEDVAKKYEENGAAAVSILTDEEYFGGSDEFIVNARKAGVKLPILYKNFVIDEYQLFQARLSGASAVLLIAADLRKDECKALLNTAHELNLEVLLEMHNENDLKYIDLEPDMYGINNRNLGTFITDVSNSVELVKYLPKEACKISESGIKDAETVNTLRLIGYNGFLIGENFMKKNDPGKALKEFIDKI